MSKFMRNLNAEARFYKRLAEWFLRSALVTSVELQGRDGGERN